MPETPSAMEAARKLDAKGLGERSISVEQIAAAMDEYAESWINQDVLVSRNQRDAAIAKLADAEAKARGWCEAAANLVTDVEAAEERVRVLEAALVLAQKAVEVEIGVHEETCGQGLCDDIPELYRARDAIATAAAHGGHP